MSEIIIDGIDVSKCNYIIPPNKQCPMKSMIYAKESSCFACKENNTKLNFCKNNPNCYYKQLQRMDKGYSELMEENARILAKLEKTEFENRI